MYQIFIERVFENLKIAISLDYTNSDFEKNCASNPALFTKCDIIWMNNWMPNSMATLFMKELKEVISTFPSPEQKKSILGQAIKIHNHAAKEFNAAPRKFFSLI